jgi:hypothetical protein
MGRPRKEPGSGLMRPKDAFSGDTEDGPVTLTPNHILRADDPLVKRWPHHFVPVEPTRMRPDVEQATAAPGEVRS